MIGIRHSFPKVQYGAGKIVDYVTLEKDHEDEICVSEIAQVQALHERNGKNNVTS